MRAEKVEGLRADVENLLPTIVEVEKADSEIETELQISAEIDSLKNKKVELVFLQVKKQIKIENLDIS